MKLTQSQLRRIIKEELAAVLNEAQRVRDDSWRGNPLGDRVRLAKSHIKAKKGNDINSFIKLAIAGGDEDLEDSKDMQAKLRAAVKED